MVDDFRVDVKGQVNRLEGGAKGDLQRKHVGLLGDYGPIGGVIRVVDWWISSFRLRGSSAAQSLEYLRSAHPGV